MNTEATKSEPLSPREHCIDEDATRRKHKSNDSKPDGIEIKFAVLEANQQTCTTPALLAFFLSPQFPVAKEYFKPSVIVLNSHG